MQIWSCLDPVSQAKEKEEHLLGFPIVSGSLKHCSGHHMLLAIDPESCTTLQLYFIWGGGEALGKEATASSVQDLILDPCSGFTLGNVCGTL